MRRWVALFPFLALAGAACTISSTGTSAVQVASTLPARAVVIQVSVRDAALRFVRAYAAAPRDDAAAIDALAGTPLVRSWAHWIGVQNREFPGSIAGVAEIGGIGTAAPVGGPDASDPGDILQDIPVAATIRFSARPDRGPAFAFARVMDGPIRVLLDRGGAWKVADFVRDGAPLSAVFQLIDGASVEEPGLSVKLDSFVASPAWQFNVVVTPHTRPVSMRAADVTIVDAAGSVVAVADNVSPSLSEVRAGSIVEGIIGFPMQARAKGRTLRLAFRGADALEFSLGKLIRPLGGTSASSASPSGPTTG